MEDFQLDIVVGKGPAASSHPADAAAVHARRRDHAHRDDHGPVARPLRARRPARLLRRRRAGGDRAPRRRHPARRHRRRRARGRSPAAAEARRASPTACCGACATTPRCAATARIDEATAARGCAVRRRRARSRQGRPGDPHARSACSSAAGRSGSSTLAISVGEQPETVEDMYEPFLIQQGMIARTPRGRVAMPAAFEHLGLPSPRQGLQSLFDA